MAAFTGRGAIAGGLPRYFFHLFIGAILILVSLSSNHVTSATPLALLLSNPAVSSSSSSSSSSQRLIHHLTTSQSHHHHHDVTTTATTTNNNNDLHLPKPILHQLRHRAKRTALRDPRRHYLYGIVPFTFGRDVNTAQRHVIRQVMEYYQHYSCLRFVPRMSRDGQWAKDLYSLGHRGYIEFVQRPTCHSGLGNNNGKTEVSCCTKTVCKRLIGRALGLLFEQQNPQRDGHIRVEEDRIPPDERAGYMRALPESVVEGFPFDVSSPMGYNYKRHPRAGVTLLTPDVNTVTSDFYMFHEISRMYRCRENNCSHFEGGCVNDGYVALVRGTCQCRCPQWLDSRTRCASTMSATRREHTCGGVIELTNAGAAGATAAAGSNNRDAAATATATAVGRFSKPKSMTHNCTWLVTAPAGDRILLDFDEHLFNVSVSYGECQDMVEVRHSRIGQHENYFCGTDPPKTIVSYSNSLTVVFVPGGRVPKPLSTFAASVTLVSSQNLCYNPSDRGMTYDGRVDYTKDYSRCVNWTSAAHCPHNPYNFGDTAKADLTGNYCRNPGNGLMPWCYVDAATCRRKYCDVCMLEKPFDKRGDRCANLVRWNINCTRNRTLAIDCAAMCQLKPYRTLPSALTVTCRPPPQMTDSVQADKLDRTSFAVGESVTFQCRHPNSLYRTEVSKFCLTSGGWSVGDTACLPCHAAKGYVLHGEHCYAIKTRHRTANQHNARCVRLGGQLADVRTLEEQEFIAGLAYSRGASTLYIGPNDMYREGLFRFRDYSLVSWTNWSGQDSNSEDRDCVWSDPTGLWTAGRCNRRLQAVCKIRMLRHRRRGRADCSDSRDDCRVMRDLDPLMCYRAAGNFAFTQCPLTCDRCFNH